MGKVQQVIRHPAGKLGLTVGLAIGILAALMGEASKAFFLASLCQFLAERLAH